MDVTPSLLEQTAEGVKAMLMNCTEIQTKKSDIFSICQGNQPSVNIEVSKVIAFGWSSKHCLVRETNQPERTRCQTFS